MGFFEPSVMVFAGQMCVNLVGKFPTNRQANVALTSAVESHMLSHPSKELSSQGQQLVKDLREVIDSAKMLFLKKNYHEEWQNFLYHTMQASTTPGLSNISAPVSKDEAKAHGTQVLSGLRTLGRLLVTNGQFRKLLEDATLLLRDMAADTGSRVTDKIRPDQERMGKIDEPAPSNQWYERSPKLGDVVGSKKEQAKDTQGQAKDELGRAQGQTEQTAKSQSGNINKHKTLAQTRAYLNEKFPAERRNQTVYRLKSMIVEIQQRQDYKDAINTLIGLAGDYASHTKSVVRDAYGEISRTAEESNLQKAEHELKALLENFADGTSMDDILESLDYLIDDANNDPDFKNWWKEVDAFVKRCLSEDAYIMKEESTDQWNKLLDSGRYLLNERYHERTERLVDNIKRFFDYMSNDPDNIAFGNKVHKLFTDLGQDANGDIVFKKHLLDDVIGVIIPGFFQKLGYVPVCISAYRINHRFRELKSRIPKWTQ
jgi:Family of unknown function (DUF5923)